MAFVVKDRVKETTTTTGTGTITLAGAVSGFQAFSAIGNGNTTYYTIAGGSEWEVGVGTYTSSGTTLSRDVILESSNSGSAVNFSAGVKDVFVTYPAERSVEAVGSGVRSDTGSVYINKTTMTQDTVIDSGENGFAVGPLTVASGVSFTVTAGQTFYEIGGTGATGAGGDQVFVENTQTVTTSYSIPSGRNAMSTGPITVDSGATVTIPTGSRWVVI
jgi:hypothetical protein